MNNDLKSITSNVVKEGDILVIEGGIAKHIINPKKRSEKITGAYATVYNSDLIPHTVYVDVNEADESNIENAARAKAVETSQKIIKLPNSNVRNNNAKKKDNGEGSARESNQESSKKMVEVTVLSLSEPKKDDDVLVIVAQVQGIKGKFSAVARGRHAERLVALEGETAFLVMSKQYDEKYKGYKVEEVHFSQARAVVETEIYSHDGEYFAKGQDGQEAKIVAYDLETVQKIEQYPGKKVHITLEHSKISQEDYIVTDITLAETSAKQIDTNVQEKVS